MQVRVRFAPSPTGLLHIGNAHTALFNWLFARQRGGVVILRAEDTDIQRSQQSYEKDICEDLTWLGLDWDEGLEIGGEFGPYRQSLRQAFYEDALKKLQAEGHVYPCYCSTEELAAQREADLTAGRPPRYSGRCRQLSQKEISDFEKQGRKPAWRFRVPDGDVSFTDLLRGEFTFSGSDLGDFVLVRPSGIPTYNFAVVVDDLQMQISHIIRADEHLSNTPRQVLIYQALGAKPPQFAHVAMLLGPDRQKLSKRHGAVSVAEYRAQGYLPEALLNYLALLGWTPKEGEILSKEELIQQFDFSRVALSPAVFDQEKLRWLNGQYLRQADDARLAYLAKPYLASAGLLSEDETDPTRQSLEKLVGLLKHNIITLSELPAWAEPYLAEPSFDDPKIAKLLQGEGAQKVFRAFSASITGLEEISAAEAKEILQELPAQLALGTGKVLRPLRAALTGQGKGPELGEIISFLGPERCLKRLERFIGN